MSDEPSGGSESGAVAPPTPIKREEPKPAPRREEPRREEPRREEPRREEPRATTSGELLRSIAEAAFAADVKNGDFDTDKADEEDLGAYFARLHGKVTAAFESYDAGLPLTTLSFVDEDSGEEVAENEGGTPTGMAIDLGDILLDVLSGMRLMKIDPARATALALKARQEQDEVIEDEDEDEGIAP
jgi:hypothetical protein